MCRPDNTSQNDKQAPLPYSSWQTSLKGCSVSFFKKGFHAMLQVNWGWSASCCKQLAQGMASRGVLLYTRP